MNCNKFAKYEQDYIEGRLSDSLRAEMEEHISHCEKCAEEIRIYKEINEVLSLGEEIKAPEDFTQGVMTAVYALPERGKLKAVAFAALLSVITAISSVFGFLNVLCLQQNTVVDNLSEGVFSPMVGIVEVLVGATEAINGFVNGIISAVLVYSPIIFWAFAVVLTTAGLYTALKNSVGRRI